MRRSSSRTIVATLLPSNNRRTNAEVTVLYMAYLDTLSRRNVLQLQKDTAEVLDNMEDTRRSMAVYRDGDDLQDRIREFSFTADGNRLQPKAPHTHADISERLHERLLCYNQHSIPMGFYYAKWLEKLNFYVGQINGSPSGKSVSNTPVPTPQKSSSSSIASSSAENLVTHTSMQSLMEKRAAIFDDRKDNQLKVKDRPVFMYRSNRLAHWVKTQEEGSSPHMTEDEHNAQYDQELQKHYQNTTKVGRWPYRARAPLGPPEGTSLSPFLRYLSGKEHTDTTTFFY
jgi:hypothetical protein